MNLAVKSEKKGKVEEGEKISGSYKTDLCRPGIFLKFGYPVAFHRKSKKGYISSCVTTCRPNAEACPVFTILTGSFIQNFTEIVLQ